MKNILSISDKLKAHNRCVYIVGGYCRDKILGEKNDSEVDLCTNATPEEIKIYLDVKREVGKKYGTSIVQEAGEIFEITTLREDIGILDNRHPVEVKFTQDINKDAQRRDFSCNAIYLDPVTQDYIDPVGGIQDLKNNIIRFIGNTEERIQEDALRILRYIRFKYKYNFTPAEDYTPILQQNIELLKHISHERIKEELDLILTGNNNIDALEELKQIGFLKLFFPEIDKQSTTPGSKFHQEGDVWTHTKMTLGVLNEIISREKITGKECLDLYWTMFLHDIAKPACFFTSENGNNHYYGHEEEGAEMFLKIAKQFHFSKTTTKKINWLIENHLRVFKIHEMKPLKANKLMMHPLFPTLMIVGEADHMGRIPAGYNVVEALHKKFYNFHEKLNKTKLFSGKDIIKKYPELSGAAIGEQLKQENDQIISKL